MTKSASTAELDRLAAHLVAAETAALEAAPVDVAPALARGCDSDRVTRPRTKAHLEAAIDEAEGAALYFTLRAEARGRVAAALSAGRL